MGLGEAVLTWKKLGCAFTIENRRVEVGDPVEALPRVRIAGEYTQEGFEYLVEPNGGEQ